VTCSAEPAAMRTRAEGGMTGGGERCRIAPPRADGTMPLQKSHAQDRQNALVIAQGALCVSTVHFTGASFAIVSYVGEHGFPLATELEFVGLAVLGLSAVLSGCSLMAAMRIAAVAAFAVASN